MRSASASVSAWRAQLTPVTADGARTFVLQSGVGDPVVFLHGIPTQAYLWRDVARFVRRTHRVVAPDLLGFGFADRPAGADYSPYGQATFVERVLTELDISHYALVVHDYGALVGAELLARNPDRVRHLVVLNTSFWEEDWRGSGWSPFRLLRTPAVGEIAFRLARKFMLRKAFELYVDEHARLTSATMDVYWDPFTDGYSDVLLTLFRDARSQLNDASFCRWRDAIEAFDRPSLVVWGDKDPTFQTWIGRRIASILPAGHLEILEHSNHFVPEDRPEALARLINALLSGHLRE